MNKSSFNLSSISIAVPLTTSLIIASTFSFQAQSVELSKHLSTIIEPKPINRVAPRYPINAIRQGREGWAKLSFVIDEQGKVSNVLVIETSGSKDFAKAARSAVLKWQYKPAFENGKPIQQCVNTVQMDFSMKDGGEKGVSRRFKKKYKKAKKALENKDYPQVKILLAEMTKTKKMHLSENNFMHFLAADYAKAINDKPLQLFHLNRTTLSIKGKQKLAALYNIFQLKIELQQYKSAHTTYQNIIKMKEAEPYLPQLEKMIKRVDEFIVSDQELLVHGKIQKSGFWSTELIRKEFSLVDIDGSLDRLDVRCANKRHVYTVESNNTWKLPDSWKNCSLYIFGNTDTSFNFIEHPLEG